MPLLPAASVAHSATTGQGTDDHHAEAHTAAHASGGADAIKSDDLATSEDDTDLDFSTFAHGLVPKGTNACDFLKDDGSWAAPAAGGGGAVTREGGDTTEATTTSTSAVELSAITGLIIAAATQCKIIGNARKTSGAAADGSIGLRLNSTIVDGPANSGAGCWVSAGSNSTQDGLFEIAFGSRVTNCLNACTSYFMARTSSSAVVANSAGPAVDALDTAVTPNAEITDIDTMGISGSASVTLGLDEEHI